MSRRYDQYCPIAYALDVVGERWSLLVVRELTHGPLRYTDLLGRLGGCSTNVLAARLRTLEEGGVVRRRTLPPPFASTVYELTESGMRLRRVLFALAHWGLQSLGPPAPGLEKPEGWLEHALWTAVAPAAPAGRFTFRVEGDTASLVDGAVSTGEIEDADVIVDCNTAGLYALLAEGRTDAEQIRVEGDVALLERLVAAVAQTDQPAPAGV